MTLKNKNIGRYLLTGWLSMVLMISYAQQNYVRTHTYQQPKKLKDVSAYTGKESEQQSTQYFDEMGRPVQLVIRQASPNGKDIVTPIYYDAKDGRESREYLPYEQNDSGTGNYVQDAFSKQNSFYKAKFNDTRPYSETKLSFGQVKEQYGPGQAWTSKPVKYAQELDNNVIQWEFGSLYTQSKFSIYPQDNKLVKTTTVDEQGNTSIIYKDRQGKLILKKVQIGVNDYASTYYIYDDFNQLSVVIPPEGNKNINEFISNQSILNLKNSTLKEERIAFLDKWAFQYTYDKRGRMIAKKVPGVSWKYMIYDQWDRLVLSQTKEKKWVLTKYDYLNRPIQTFLFVTNQTVSQLRDLVKKSTVHHESFNKDKTNQYTAQTIFSDKNLQPLTVTYYDNYDFLNQKQWGNNYRHYNFNSKPKPDYAYAKKGSGYTILKENYTLKADDKKKKFAYLPDVQVDITGDMDFTEDGFEITPIETKDMYINPTKNESVKSLVTGTMVWEGGKWLKQVSYYDKKYRVIQVHADNHLGGLDEVTNYYSFSGKLEMSLAKHRANGQETKITQRKEYDHVGRLLNTYHRINNETEVLLKQNKYDALGKLIEKGLHSTGGDKKVAQSVDYEYNIRGWLTKINQVDLSAGRDNDLFGMELYYEKNPLDKNNNLYDGNISAVRWKSYSNSHKEILGYDYKYDGLSRLKDAYKYEGTGSDRTHNVFFNYDKNGNIQTLRRYGNDPKAEEIDDLKYKYNGNKLILIKDKSNDVNGFKDGNTSGDDYAYDLNGNTIKDRNKGIEEIKYNYRNLPVEVHFKDGKRISYRYTASGVKLSEQVKIGNKVSKTDYVGGFIYQRGKLAMVQHAEGRIVPKYGKWDYQYHLKDHLGNVRLTFSNMAERHTIVEDFEGQNHGFKNLHAHTNARANTTRGGNKVERLTSGQSGAMLLMRVNKGDTLNLQVKANYETPPAKNSLLPIGYTTLFGAFNASYGRALEGVANNASNAMNQALSGTNMTSKGANNTAPRAFLNYIYFDKNMQHLRSGFKQISTAAQGVGRHETLVINEILADQEGYVLAYLSNENKEPVQVHFDDFTILHKKTNIVQSQDYYPFGLTFNKYKRAGAFENDFLFGGVEINNQTGNYETLFRGYSPSIGRFMQIDPLADFLPSINPYQFAFNNPILFNDPTGLYPQRRGWWRRWKGRLRRRWRLFRAWLRVGGGDSWQARRSKNRNRARGLLRSRKSSNNNRRPTVPRPKPKKPEVKIPHTVDPILVLFAQPERKPYLNPVSPMKITPEPLPPGTSVSISGFFNKTTTGRIFLVNRQQVTSQLSQIAMTLRADVNARVSLQLTTNLREVPDMNTSTDYVDGNGRKLTYGESLREKLRILARVLINTYGVNRNQIWGSDEIILPNSNSPGFQGTIIKMR